MANLTAAVNATGHGPERRDRRCLTKHHIGGALDRSEKQLVDEAYDVRWKGRRLLRAALGKKVGALQA